MADFEKQSYWRDRFAHETNFEWLVKSEELMEILDPILASASLGPDAHILQLGFGTSDLQNHFRARGYLDVTNADYEPLAIQRGKDLERRTFGDVRMRYVVADATQMPEELTGCGNWGQSRSWSQSRGQSHSQGQFDLVIDKSTADAVACGGDEALLRMARGVRKCLAPGGAWVSLSYSASRFRVEGLPFDVEVVHKFPAPRFSPNEPEVFHWLYMLRPKV